MLNKKILLAGIKYGPSALCITCCLKILLLSWSPDPTVTGEIVNWINLVFNLAALGYLWASGRFLGYCWKHASLCRIALWGYLFYAVYLAFPVPPEVIRPIAIYYCVYVLFKTILYKEVS